MMRFSTLLLTGVLGLTFSANAVCTVYIAPYKPSLQSAQRAADKKSAYETLVKVVTRKGWVVSRHQNTADISASSSCLGDRGDMMANIVATDNRTGDEIEFHGYDAGFFIDGECAPAVRDAGKKFPYCE